MDPHLALDEIFILSWALVSFECRVIYLLFAYEFVNTLMFVLLALRTIFELLWSCKPNLYQLRGKPFFSYLLNTQLIQIEENCHCQNTVEGKDRRHRTSNSVAVDTQPWRKEWSWYYQSPVAGQWLTLSPVRMSSTVLKFSLIGEPMPNFRACTTAGPTMKARIFTAMSLAKC